MRTVTKSYEVYTYDELDQPAKDKAVNEYIQFILDTVDSEYMSENVRRACDDATELQTPWFAGQYIWDYARDEIEADLREQSYLKSGEVDDES